MGQITAAEWIMLSEIFRGQEEKCHQLLREMSAHELLSANWNTLYHAGKLTKALYDRYKKFDLATAEQIEMQCSKYAIRIITPDSKDYPGVLLNFYDPPIVLYAVGDAKLLQEINTLTVVGTRKATEYGLKTSFLLSREVAKKGVVIISGCAVGIDTMAHRGALAAGGKTISVLGCGLDVNYPQENYQLRKEITRSGGLLITEYPPGTKPTPSFFPHRNRILAGLARGVLVVEAPYRSGSLITAEYAVEQGKEVFCVPPYSIWDADCSGVTRYLRDGAIPAMSPADILLHYFTIDETILSSDDFLDAAIDLPETKKRQKFFQRTKKKAKEKPVKESKAEVPKEKQESAEKESAKEPQKHGQPDSKRFLLPPQITDDRFREVFSHLDERPRVIDELILGCDGLAPGEVMAILNELEMMGLVQNHSGNRYSVLFEPKLDA